MKKQIIVSGNNSYKKIESIFQKEDIKKCLLVCDRVFDRLFIKEYILSLGPDMVRFDDFTPNPLYEDVVKGLQVFKSSGCDAILAVGGGSALDVAKCIKLFSAMDDSISYLDQKYSDIEIPVIAVPTTAGTGSESTRHAVIYYNGVKQSISHDSIVPDYAVLEHRLLETLPLYQKKCTVLDALCQGIESFWSVNSTDESKEYSKKAIGFVAKNLEIYLLLNNDDTNREIMLASNYAGRAISITQTTAAHAMSYKITSLFGIPHGHAVAICLPHVWRYMYNNPDKCIDSRGTEYILSVFREIAGYMGHDTVYSAIDGFESLLAGIGISPPDATDEDIDILCSSVNQKRLINNPVALDVQDIRQIYRKIFNK